MNKRPLSLPLLLIVGCAGPSEAVGEHWQAPAPSRPALALQLAGEPSSCIGGLVHVGERSYCVIDEPLSWHEAARRCAYYGSYLAQFESRAEQRALVDAVRSPLDGVPFWVGLSRARGEWHWSGEPLRYASWRPGEPNNTGGNERCGEWLSQDGRFNDLPCDQRRAVLCEGHAESQSCAGQLIQTGYGTYCAYSGERLSWRDARAYCQASDWKLAALETKVEAEVLAHSQASRIRHTQLWLGVTDEVEEGQWVWGKGGAVQNAKWGQGQPDNYNEEHCAEWRLDRDDWNDTLCDVPRAALCESGHPVESGRQPARIAE